MGRDGEPYTLKPGQQCAVTSSVCLSLGCRRAALAVAVGSIVRSKGGIALQSALNLTAETLLAAAQVCPGPAQLWLLHGMWLIVNSAGPAFLPHVTVSTPPRTRFSLHT